MDQAGKDDKFRECIHLAGIYPVVVDNCGVAIKPWDRNNDIDLLSKVREQKKNEGRTGY